MNKKVSLVLRIVAILAAGAAIGLYFMVKGQMENAFLKTQPLDTVLGVKTQTLDKRVEKTKVVADEVFELRETKERNENQIASLKATINQKNDEIDGLKSDLDAKTEEANQLTRDKEALTSEVSDLNGKVSDLEGQLRSEKERVAQLTEEKSNTTSSAYPSARHSHSRRRPHSTKPHPSNSALLGALSSATDAHIWCRASVVRA